MNKVITSSLGVFFGVYVTYFLVQQNFMSSVMASSLCGLIASIFLIDKIKKNDIAIAIYCGSFAGMGNVFNVKELIIPTFIAIVLMFIWDKIFRGFGGKLGFIAYVSSVFSEIIIILVGAKKIGNHSLLNVLTNFNPISEISMIIGVVLASVLGFYTTVFFHHTLKKSAVFSSALPSFVVGVLAYFSNFYGSDLVAVTFFSASFVGMIAEDILPKKHFPILILTHILIIVLFKHNFGSYGGALGTMAFLSVSILIQLDMIIFRKNKKQFNKVNY